MRKFIQYILSMLGYVVEQLVSNPHLSYSIPNQAYLGHSVSDETLNPGTGCLYRRPRDGFIDTKGHGTLGETP
jgi:hypothetical protein